MYLYMAKYYEVRRDGSNVLMELARLPRKVVTIAKKPSLEILYQLSGNESLAMVHGS